MAGGFGANTVSARQRQMILDTMKKGGLGVPTLSGTAAPFYTVAHTGVGDYLVSPKSGSTFAQVPEIGVTLKTNDRIARIGVVTKLAIQIITEDLAGVAAEADFDLFISGCLAQDLIS